MPRFRTDRIQTSGYSLLKGRIIRAMLHRDTQDVTSDNSSFKRWASGGLIVASLFAGAGAGVKLFSPGSGLGDSTYVVTKDGTQLVNYSGQWHEVANTASARLILGSPEDPKSVKADALEGAARGPLMGILGGPGPMVPREDANSEWNVCTQYSPASRTNLLDTTAVDTIVIAGDELDTRAKTLGRGESVLVRDLGRSTYWLLLDNGQKMRVKPSDEQVMNALGIDQSELKDAANVSTQMLATLDTLPDLEKPTIEGEGANSTAVSEYRNGTVLTVDMPDRRDFYIVGDKGVQKIPPFIARWVATTGGTVLEGISPDRVSALPSAEGVIDTSNYPADVPHVKIGKSVCSVWTKTADNADSRKTVAVADTLPIPQEKADAAVELMPVQGASGPTADFAYTPAGKGWFVRVTGLADTSLEKSALYWISDTGVAHPIAPGDDGKLDKTVEALGLGGRIPHLVPQQFVDLYVPGPALSAESAMTMHSNPPADPEQQVVKKDEGH